ncbi:ribbon-helix-helix domain-containing protein [Patescibacteria group bacterium]|nr:ribbon-helix-helix domain-containing protein [Candidatus Micrarchaeota archaeon]MBU1758376.1 ribbon-helix-helix domain-containing protein [Patescibacteria group bacterium]
MAEENKYTTVSIPRPLYDKVKERIKDTGFTSVSDYVVFVLRELMTEEEQDEEAFSKEDEENIKSRLRALGYIE